MVEQWWGWLNFLGSSGTAVQPLALTLPGSPLQSQAAAALVGAGLGCWYFHPLGLCGIVELSPGFQIWGKSGGRGALPLFLVPRVYVCAKFLMDLSGHMGFSPLASC